MSPPSSFYIFFRACFYFCCALYTQTSNICSFVFALIACQIKDIYIFLKWWNNKYILVTTAATIIS